MSGVVQFGKYKGQPVETLAADREYVDWLLQQSWFKEKHVMVYNTVVQFNQPAADTPEHNRIQILFTDDDFTKRFISLARDDDFFKMDEITSFKVEFEHRTSYATRRGDRKISPPVDVMIFISGNRKEQSYRYDLRVEIKPTMSDDYPAVLRQIKENGAEILLLETYTGIGATFDQMVKFFNLSDVGVYTLDCITNYETKVDCFFKERGEPQS